MVSTGEGRAGCVGALQGCTLWARRPSGAPARFTALTFSPFGADQKQNTHFAKGGSQVNISAAVPGSSVLAALALKSEGAAQAAAVALLKKGLDMQVDLAAQLFESLGIGGNLDVKV